MKYLLNIHPRIIYIFVALALAIPMIFKVSFIPVPMKAAEDTFKVMAALPDNSKKPVVIALDWGPGTMAENEPQSKLIMEHLFRKKIPFILMTLYVQAAPILQELPLELIKTLKKENPEFNFQYGVDWVNLGYQAGGWQAVQAIARSEEFHNVLKNDSKGTPIGEIPLMQNVHTLKDVSLLVQITSLVGTFNTWLQFFRIDSYTPPMLHGCTSISIPDAYLYYSSKQILGFFEGVAGAAWYEQLMDKVYPKREDYAIGTNTGLAFAQLVILLFIVLGNITYLIEQRSKRK